MSKETSVDVGIWERIGDGLSAFSEGVSRFLTRVMGSSNERYVRKLWDPLESTCRHASLSIL